MYSLPPVTGAGAAFSPPQAGASASGPDPHGDKALQAISDIKKHIAVFTDSRNLQFDQLKEVVDGISSELGRCMQAGDASSGLMAKALTNVLQGLHEVCAAFQAMSIRSHSMSGGGREISFSADACLRDTCAAMRQIVASNLGGVTLPQVATLVHVVTFLPATGREELQYISRFMDEIAPMVNVAVYSIGPHVRMLGEEDCRELIEIGTRMQQVLRSGSNYVAASGESGDSFLRAAVGVFGGLAIHTMRPTSRTSEDLQTQVDTFNAVLKGACDNLNLRGATQRGLAQAQKKGADEDLVSQAFSVVFPNVFTSEFRPSASTRTLLGR